METTWDGLPVARERPFAACVVVWREGVAAREFLVLHRAHFGPDFGGDWAWTPPAGARQPGESADEAAARELREETGLELPCVRVESPNPDVAHYVAEALPGAAVTLDAEHDAHRWLPLDAAADLCLPATVADGLRVAAASLG
ncbi:MAG TPA: NUDIX domain-containing protein [Gaiellaceae bacterium]|nr:NUDIX domain-containing protein [Gaiellaceae bacterium]